VSNAFARHPRAWKSGAIALACAGLVTAGLTYSSSDAATTIPVPVTTTPIKHVVVLFDENQSFDHYFGTYPNAAFPLGKDQAGGDGSAFTKSAVAPRTSDGTPINNYNAHPELLTSNPNTVQPFRLSHDQAWTCSQNHAYLPEQKAVSGVLPDGSSDGNENGMDTFVQNTSKDTCTGGGSGPLNKTGETMGFYDGNTVTGLWNYAQNYAMSDNSWADNFGPSTVGALNLVSGQTYGAKSYDGSTTASTTTPTQLPNPVANNPFSVSNIDPTTGVGTVIGDPQPAYDDCAQKDHTATSGNTAAMQDANKNVGDLLNDKSLTWGYFAGGFDPTTPYNPTASAADPTVTGYAKCDALSSNIAHDTGFDYLPHHNPFAFYKSTANPHHYPASPGTIVGTDDPTNDDTHTGANHNYDLNVFYDALDQNQLPAVSIVKPIAAEDGHAGYSDPIDEQHFLTRTINAIEQSSAWPTTAIVIAYDDSDGWYDHAAPVITNGSNVTTDNAAVCLNAANAATPLGGYQDRCGPSQRLPLLVISPYAKRNYVSHTATDQTSVLRFIEDNFGLGRIGDGSFDANAGSLMDMFDFAHPRFGTTLLRADGTVKGATKTPIRLTVAHTKVRSGKTTITVTAWIGSTTYHPVGKITGTVNGKAITAKTLSSTGKAVWTGFRLPATTNKLVFKIAATEDYAAAQVATTIKR